MDYLGKKTLKDLWNEMVSLRKSHTFLIFEDQFGTVHDYTYQDFDSLVNRVANGLRNRGVGYQSKVTVHLNNSPEFLLIWFACAKLGAIIVPSNIQNIESEIEYILEYSDSILVITEEEFLPRIEAVLPNVKKIEQVVLARTNRKQKGYLLLDDWLNHEERDEPDAKVNQSDILGMLFTSGTTAQPKGVLLTHANHLAAGQRVSKHLRLTPRDRSLTTMPLFHVNAQSLTVLSTLTVGGTVVLIEKYSATKFMGQLRTHKATQTSIVPMILRTVLAQPKEPHDKEHYLDSIFFAINVLDSEKEAFEDRFGVKLLNGYGLSEAMTLVTMAPMDGNRKWPSIGLPTFDREVKIVDPNGNELPKGEVGEIIVRGVPGKTIMLGYYKNEKATSETIKNGWLYTGDNGFVDEQGYIYFFDRKKDMIKQAGENISATDVERVLMTHPTIEEAAVIGVPHEIRDEVAKAFIVLKHYEQPVTEQELISWCEKNMAKYKIPHHFEFLDKLPHTSIGKIEKKVIRKLEREKRKEIQSD